MLSSGLSGYPKSRRACSSRSATVPSMTSSPSSTRTPPSTVGSTISWITIERPTCLLSAGLQAIPLLGAQRPGDPDRRDHPVLLIGRERDEAFDRVARRCAHEPRTARLASTTVASVARPSSRSPTSACRLASGTDAVADRLAQLRVGLDHPGEPEQLVLGVLQRPVVVGLDQRGPNGLPLHRRGEASGHRPSAWWRLRRRCPPPSWRSVAEETVDEILAAVLGRARIGHRPSQRHRGLERVDDREQITGQAIDVGATGRPLHRSEDLSDDALVSGAAGQGRVEHRVQGSESGLGSGAHDLPAVAGSSLSRSAMKRSTVRRARSSSSSDSPTIRPASVVARPPISLRSWTRTWARSASSWASAEALIRAASAWACSRSSTRIWVPWVLASSRIRAASVRASASCSLY